MFETERYKTTKIFEYGDAVIRVHFPEYTDAERRSIRKSQQNAAQALLNYRREKTT